LTLPEARLVSESMAAVAQVRSNVVTDVAAWAAIPVAAALTAVLLWFPSAAVGIGQRA
jgi:hypothetical protein